MIADCFVSLFPQLAFELVKHSWNTIKIRLAFMEKKKLDPATTAVLEKKMSSTPKPNQLSMYQWNIPASLKRTSSPIRWYQADKCYAGLNNKWTKSSMSLSPLVEGQNEWIDKKISKFSYSQSSICVLGQFSVQLLQYSGVFLVHSGLFSKSG